MWILTFLLAVCQILEEVDCDLVEVWKINADIDSYEVVYFTL